MSTIPAAHVATIDGNAIATNRYWQFPIQPQLTLDSDAAYALTVKDKLCEIISDYAQLESIAVTLSSGMDSTTVAAIIKNQGKEILGLSWKAPTVPDADESAYIKKLAEFLNIDVKWIDADQLWTLSADAMNSQLEYPIQNYYDEAWEATLKIAADHNIKHIFTGIGGDQCFGCWINPNIDLLFSAKFRLLTKELSYALKSRKNKKKKKTVRKIE